MKQNHKRKSLLIAFFCGAMLLFSAALAFSLLPIHDPWEGWHLYFDIPVVGFLGWLFFEGLCLMVFLQLSKTDNGTLLSLLAHLGAVLCLFSSFTLLGVSLMMPAIIHSWKWYPIWFMVLVPVALAVVFGIEFAGYLQERNAILATLPDGQYTDETLNAPPLYIPGPTQCLQHHPPPSGHPPHFPDRPARQPIIFNIYCLT